MMYNKKFYAHMKNGRISNLTSAQQIVPYLIELFPQTKSVIDFGCGAGTWLACFSENGINDIRGIDGDWVNEDELMVDNGRFEAQDLSKRIHLSRKYDMAISLEVAEHLDGKSADVFVDNLVDASDLIVFSAAIPNQGGVHHVNEQWQSYWRSKFALRGYIAIDPIRGKFANNPMVMPYYAQNTLVYINKERVDNYQEIKKYINMPFVTDIAFPNMTLDATPKSWHFIGRSLIRMIKIIVRKIFHIREYRRKEMGELEESKIT